jgi:hypothetical protein
MKRKSSPRDEPEVAVWKMPKWMEPYRDLFQNTGGNSIEDLMNDHDTNGFNNVIRSALIVSVDSQITLLHRMARRGMLMGVDTETPKESQKGEPMDHKTPRRSE